MSVRRAAITDDEVVGFLGPARDLETERWRALGRTRRQAMSEEQILRAVCGQRADERSSIFPTAHVSDVPVPAHPLQYVDRYTPWRPRRHRGEIGTLPLVVRLLRVSVWMAAGILMLLGMVLK
jgi:hypothetical protein